MFISSLVWSPAGYRFVEKSSLSFGIHYCHGYGSYFCSWSGLYHLLWLPYSRSNHSQPLISSRCLWIWLSGSVLFCSIPFLPLLPWFLPCKMFNYLEIGFISMFQHFLLSVRELSFALLVDCIHSTFQLGIWAFALPSIFLCQFSCDFCSGYRKFMLY